MKYIAEYSFIGIIAMLAFVAAITPLHLDNKITNNIIIIVGVILFTCLGGLLKNKVRINPMKKTDRLRK